MPTLNPEGLAVEKTRCGNLPRYGNFKGEQRSQGAAGFPEQGVVQSTLHAKEEPWKAAPKALRHFLPALLPVHGISHPRGSAGLGFSP